MHEKKSGWVFERSEDIETWLEARLLAHEKLTFEREPLFLRTARP